MLASDTAGSRTKDGFALLAAELLRQVPVVFMFFGDFLAF